MGKMMLPDTDLDPRTGFAQYPLQHAQKVIADFVSLSPGITVMCECFWNRGPGPDMARTERTFELAMWQDLDGNIRVKPLFLNVANALAAQNYDDTTESTITATVNEHLFLYSGFVMATQYDDPALSLCRHILKTSSLTDPDTGECSIDVLFTQNKSGAQMTEAAKSLVSALCRPTPSLKHEDLIMYVDTPDDPGMTILALPQWNHGGQYGIPGINLKAVLVSHEYEVHYRQTT